MRLLPPFLLCVLGACAAAGTDGGSDPPGGGDGDDAFRPRPQPEHLRILSIHPERIELRREGETLRVIGAAGASDDTDIDLVLTAVGDAAPVVLATPAEDGSFDATVSSGADRIVVVPAYLNLKGEPAFLQLDATGSTRVLTPCVTGLGLLPMSVVEDAATSRSSQGEVTLASQCATPSRLVDARLRFGDRGFTLRAPALPRSLDGDLVSLTVEAELAVGASARERYEVLELITDPPDITGGALILHVPSAAADVQR